MEATNKGSLNSNNSRANDTASQSTSSTRIACDSRLRLALLGLERRASLRSEHRLEHLGVLLEHAWLGVEDHVEVWLAWLQRLLPRRHPPEVLALHPRIRIDVRVGVDGLWHLLRHELCRSPGTTIRGISAARVWHVRREKDARR
eukprot:2449183-Rhodomonas_salina.2